MSSELGAPALGGERHRPAAFLLRVEGAARAPPPHPCTPAAGERAGVGRARSSAPGQSLVRTHGCDRPPGEPQRRREALHFWSESPALSTWGRDRGDSSCSAPVLGLLSPERRGGVSRLCLLRPQGPPPLLTQHLLGLLSDPEWKKQGNWCKSLSSGRGATQDPSPRS